jgi:hypothetical protein
MLDDNFINTVSFRTARSRVGQADEPSRMIEAHHHVFAPYFELTQ